jgi:hypothetical protein
MSNANQPNNSDDSEFLAEVIDLMEENNIEFPKSNPDK